MEESSTYSVVASGELQSGFDLTQVQAAFAEFFKVTPEKASSIVGSKKILKNNLSLETAQAYQRKLEDIGLVIQLLEKSVPVSPKPSFSLALEPTEEELTRSMSPQANTSPQQVSDNDIFECPKCHLKQAKTDQCTGCGVYTHKVMASENTNSVNAVAPIQETSIQSTEHESAEEQTSVGDSLNSKSILAAASAAIVGALLWKFIAVAFDYELGIIAWLIGGAVGFAAAMFGSRGQAAGVVCGVFTVIAIMGGKYMAMESFQAEFSNTFMEEFNNEEFKYIYEEELSASKFYVEQVSDDVSIRQFMVDYGYSEYSEVNEVSQEELSDFKETVVPHFEKNVYNKPTFEQWLEDGFKSEIENLSTWDLMEESLGLIDIVFLLLGVATAFKLGSRQGK